MKLTTALLLSCITSGAIAREIVHPVGEHDHFLGTVKILGSGAQAYPDGGRAPEVSISFQVADKSVTSKTVIHEADSTDLRATPLKNRPGIQAQYEIQGGMRCQYDYTYYDVNLRTFTADKQGFEFFIHTHRIDVNDMKITRQDGSAYYARGHYWVKMEDTDKGDCWILSKANTKSGISVPHGYKYKVVTEATSEEGSELQSTVTLDFDRTWSTAPVLVSPTASE